MRLNFDQARDHADAIFETAERSLDDGADVDPAEVASTIDGMNAAMSAYAEQSIAYQAVRAEFGETLNDVIEELDDQYGS